MNDLQVILDGIKDELTQIRIIMQKRQEHEESMAAKQDMVMQKWENQMYSNKSQKAGFR
jgi:hypothetical protein